MAAQEYSIYWSWSAHRQSRVAQVLELLIELALLVVLRCREVGGSIPYASFWWLYFGLSGFRIFESPTAAAHLCACCGAALACFSKIFLHLFVSQTVFISFSAQWLWSPLAWCLRLHVGLTIVGLSKLLEIVSQLCGRIPIRYNSTIDRSSLC